MNAQILMWNLALMKAFGLKRLPFISVIHIFVDYTKDKNHENARLDYKISYCWKQGILNGDWLQVAELALCEVVLI